METYSLLQQVFLFLIGSLALLTIVFSSPSYNALFLTLETILIAFYLALTNKIHILNAHPLTLLLFFCLIIISCNLYIEKSTQISQNSPPKLSIITGISMLIFFQLKLPKIINNDLSSTTIKYSYFKYDIMAILCAIFIIFIMLISALIVLNIRNQE
ncbi:MAG: hypothetical protein KC505_07565 [Myxococcales bacterium]|nr:hypothetical protein [Myxococcales bacterium]USN51574.1 MAG: hypothetical protein H6731_03965 [Myxococcales bacterium]